MACSAQSLFQLLPLSLQGKKLGRETMESPCRLCRLALPAWHPLPSYLAQGRAEALRQSTKVLPGWGKPATVRPMLWRGPGQAKVWGRYLLSLMAYAACQPRSIRVRRWSEEDSGSCIWRETTWSGWDTGSCQGLALICRAGRALLALYQHWRQDGGGVKGGTGQAALCPQRPVPPSPVRRNPCAVLTAGLVPRQLTLSPSPPHWVSPHLLLHSQHVTGQVHVSPLHRVAADGADRGQKLQLPVLFLAVREQRDK